MKDFPDETLMRFADGELPAQEAAVVEAAINADDALAERVAMFLETRMAAQQAFAPLADEPPPEALRQSVQVMVDASRAKRRASNRWLPANDWLPAAAAAALVAGVLGVGAGYWLGAPQQGGALALTTIEDSALTKALAATPSGSEANLPTGRFRAIATLRDAGQTLCREFEIDRASGATEVAVACRESAGWTVRFAVAAAASSEGYAPASSTEALDAYIESIGSPQPLDAEAEKAALAAIAE